MAGYTVAMLEVLIDRLYTLISEDAQQTVYNATFEVGVSEGDAVWLDNNSNIWRKSLGADFGVTNRTAFNGIAIDVEGPSQLVRTDGFHRSQNYNVYDDDTGTKLNSFIPGQKVYISRTVEGAYTHTKKDNFVNVGVALTVDTLAIDFVFRDKLEELENHKDDPYAHIEYLIPFTDGFSVIDSVDDLFGLDNSKLHYLFMQSYWTGSYKGSKILSWDATGKRGDMHDGGFWFSPTVPSPSDQVVPGGTPAAEVKKVQLQQYLDGVGETAPNDFGGWVYNTRSPISPLDYGAFVDSINKDTPAVAAAFLHPNVSLGKHRYECDYDVIEGATNCTIIGDEEYAAQIVFTGTGAVGLLTGTGYTHIENVSIYGSPTAPALYTAGTKAIVSRGNLTKTNVNIRYFDEHIRWASPSWPDPYDGNGGGFYYKFINCSYVYGNLILANLYANNFTCIGCKALYFNKLANITAGTGPFIWENGSIESWSGTAITTSAGSTCDIKVIGTYFETYPHNWPGVGSGIDPFGAAFIISTSGGVIRFADNNIQTAGIRRGISATYTPGPNIRPFSLYADGNTWVASNTADNDTEYMYVVNGPVHTVKLEDAYSEEITGHTGTYDKNYAYLSATIKYLSGYDPITEKYLSSGWKSLTLLNGWVSPGVEFTDPLEYKIIEGTLFLRGTIDGAAATDNNICVLPSIIDGALGTASYLFFNCFTLGGTFAPLRILTASNTVAFYGSSPFPDNIIVNIALPL